MIAHSLRGAAPFLRIAIVAALGVVLLGCDLVKVAPTAAPVIPSASAAASTPGPSPLSSAELAGHQYVLAAVAAFRSEPLVAHIVYAANLTSSQGSKTVKAIVSMTLDLSGREMKSAFSTRSGGKTTRADLVVVGKTAYVRSGGGGWRKAPRNGYEKDISDTIKGMRLIDDPRDLRYVGSDMVDETQLQHLTAARAIPYTASNGATGQYEKFDIWVTDEGTPVLVKATYAATLGSVMTKGTTEFRFSDFGGPIKIVAPK